MALPSGEVQAVALCGRLHLSLNIESRGWVMDETHGAIPFFA